MEIEIKRSKPEKEESKYPYLGVSKDEKSIVWFVSEGTGISIKHVHIKHVHNNYGKDIIGGWIESENFRPVKKLIVEL